MTVTATTDGHTIELVCPKCGGPVTRDPRLGIFYLICEAHPGDETEAGHLWQLPTLLDNQPTRSTT